MGKKRISPKKLKQPDEFISFSSKMLQLVVQHKRIAIAAAAVVTGVVVVAALMSYSSAKTENRGSFVLTQLMGRYRAAVKIEGPEKAYVTTRKEFHAFLDTYSGQACGRFGRLAFAHICYRAGKLDAAASLYAQAMKDFPNSRMIKDMAACGLGYCYEEKGEYKKAVGLFKSVVKDPGAVMADEAMFTLGRLYGDLGEKGKRTEILKRLAEQHPDSIYQKIAQEEGA